MAERRSSIDYDLPPQSRKLALLGPIPLAMALFFIGVILSAVASFYFLSSDRAETRAASTAQILTLEQTLKTAEQRLDQARSDLAKSQSANTELRKQVDQLQLQLSDANKAKNHLEDQLKNRTGRAKPKPSAKPSTAPPDT